MAEGRQRRYHGFVSYSHRGDLSVAPALQQALQRMARPWSKRNALSVFRDQTGLSVNPALWTSITVALDDSEWFVLLASPESARSEWVGKEIIHWIETRGTDRLLPVITEGEWVWDADAGDLDWSISNAAHPALQGVFDEEPATVDLRWARKDTDLSLSNPTFRDAVAQIAAPLHGISDAEIVEEHFRQERRTRRLVRSAAVALAVLGLMASVAGVVAITRARDANDQRDRAVTEARLATAASLSNRSTTVAGSDRARGILLALESYRLEPSASAEASIRSLLGNDLTGLLHGASDGIVDLAMDIEGTQLAAVDGSGSVHVWQLGTRERSLSTEAARYSTAAWVSDAELVVGDLDGRVRLLDVVTGESKSLIDGATLVTDTTTGLTRTVVTANQRNGLIAVGLNDGSIAVLDATGNRQYEISDAPDVVGTVVHVLVTSDARLIAHYGWHQIDVWQLDGGDATLLTESQEHFQQILLEQGRVVGNFAGGLAIDPSESMVASGVEAIDARTGKLLSSQGCGPMISTGLASATTFVGGREYPLVGLTGGGGLSVGDPVPTEFSGMQDPEVQELCLQTGISLDSSLPITGSVWALAARDDALILVGAQSDEVLMVRYGAAQQRKDLAIDDLLGLACYIAGRNLTDAEWKTALPAVSPEQICAQWPETHESTPSAIASIDWSDGG